MGRRVNVLTEETGIWGDVKMREKEKDEKERSWQRLHWSKKLASSKQSCSFGCQTL